MRATRRGFLGITILTVTKIPNTLFAQISRNNVVSGGGYVIPVFDNSTLLIPNHMVPDDNRVEFHTSRARGTYKIESIERILGVDVAILNLKRPQNLMEPLEVSRIPTQIGEEYILSLREEYEVRALKRLQYPPELENPYEGVFCIGSQLRGDGLILGFSGLPMLNQNREVVAIQSYKPNVLPDGLQPTIVANVGGIERLLDN